MELNLQWSPPKVVQTRYGEKTVRTAPATPEFWELYKSHKDDLFKAGYSVKKNDWTGEWIVTQWGELPEEIIEKKKATLEASRATDANFDPPAPEGKEYFPFQKAGIKFACEREATLIGDDMGLGKTIQGIGIINVTAPKSVLIVCPATMRLVWKRALSQWLVHERKITLITSTKDTFPSKPEIVITNFEMAVRFEKQIKAIYWDLFIADEAHYLKNPKAQRTKALLGYNPGKRSKNDPIPPVQAKRRVLMTGTPIVNRPVELWPLIHYLDPKTWNNFMSFAKRYCNAHHNGWGWDFTGASNLEELQRRLRETIMIRRLKDEVLTDLPPKIRQVVPIEADELSGLIKAENEAYNAYEAKILELRVAVELAKASDKPEVYRQAVQELRDEVDAAFEEISKLRHETALAKIPHVIEHLESVSGKVVIFCHHHDVVDAIKSHLGDRAVVLTGKTSFDERKLAEDRFQTDPDVQFFIGTIRAAGVGITLTASAHVIFAELDWVPGNVSQAEDRCRRIGQNSSVLVQHLVLDGSLDARMAHILVNKQEVIDKTLDTEIPELETPKFEIFSKEIATKSETRESLAEEAKKLSPDVIEAIQECLQLIASMDSDMATEKNEVGFNGLDTQIGHSLALLPALTPKQAALGKKLLGKYHRQLPADLYGKIFPERVQ